MLRSGAGDLGLLTLPVEAPDLVSVPVLRGGAAASSTYPNASAGEEAHDHARRSRQAAVHPVRDRARSPAALVDEFFTRERIEPEIVMETENVEIIKAMVRSGLGISIVPWQAVAGDVAGEAAVRAAGSPATRWSGRSVGSIRR